MSDLAWLSRTQLQVGDVGLEKLQSASVLEIGRAHV